MSAHISKSVFTSDDHFTKHIDDGWLVGTSELHLQLGTLGKALSISDHPPHTRYLLTLTPFTQAHTQVRMCRRVYVLQLSHPPPQTHTHTHTDCQLLSTQG